MSKNAFRRILTILICLSGTALCLAQISQAASREGQHLVIPAYFYPGPLWEQATAAAPKVGAMIMNPNSGPGAAPNPDYVAAVNKARAAGIRVLGYVHTSYGARDASVVKAEIDAYKDWYSVDGIFLDETASGVAALPYYQELAGYIRARPGKLIMLNPGVVPDERYLGVGDVVVVFEGTYSSYQEFQLPRWVFTYPANRFAHLVYGVATTKAMKNTLSLSQKRNAGSVYVTEDDLPNPWDTLPGYWKQELKKLPAKSR